jgi:cystathionine beta-lyase/cystathionine gamma-synthase
MTTKRRPGQLATRAAHGVRAPAPESLPAGQRSVPSAEPIFQTAVFDFPSIDASLVPLAQEGGYAYGRFGLPNGRSLELSVAALEGAEDGVATASGMAAISAAILACAGAGDRVLLQRDAYGGTGALFTQDFARLGLRVELVDAYDGAAVTRALAAPAAALLVETYANPLLLAVDLPALARACAAAGVAFLVDNTFATPILCRPLELGARAVVHSGTKFLGGHHDLTVGVLVGDAELCGKARAVVRRFGMAPGALDAWLACRGLKTLAVRMERSCATAAGLARRLRADARVTAVRYPEAGALVSFDVGDGARAAALVAALELITLTPSLGGVTTTLSHAATSSHRGLTPDARRALGIGDGLLRMSVGLEDEGDLWSDLDSALGSLS